MYIKILALFILSHICIVSVKAQDSLSIYFNRAMSNYRIYKFKEAIKDIDVFLKQKHIDSLYAIRGFSKYHTGDFKGAIADLTIAINLGYDSVNLLLERGRYYKYLKKIDSAEADFTKVILINKRANGYRERALLYTEQKKFDMALKDWNEQIDWGIDTGRLLGSSYYYRAVCHNKLHNYVESIIDADRAIKLDPTNGFAVQAMAWSLLALGYKDKACEKLQFTSSFSSSDKTLYEIICK